MLPFQAVGLVIQYEYIAIATTVAPSPFLGTLTCISIGLCTKLVLGRNFDMVSRKHEKTPVSNSSYCAGNFRAVVCCYCHIHFLLSCQSNSNYHGSHELSSSKKEPWWVSRKNEKVLVSLSCCWVVLATEHKLLLLLYLLLSLLFL